MIGLHFYLIEGSLCLQTYFAEFLCNCNYDYEFRCIVMHFAEFFCNCNYSNVSSDKSRAWNGTYRRSKRRERIRAWTISQSKGIDILNYYR